MSIYTVSLSFSLRKAPLHSGHLTSMLAATEMGAIIVPPVPASYFRLKA
jgi:flavin prenyltransferase